MDLIIGLYFLGIFFSPPARNLLCLGFGYSSNKPSNWDLKSKLLLLGGGFCRYVLIKIKMDLRNVHFSVLMSL